MKKLVAIGEALIDFISNDLSMVKDSNSFTPVVGGAPLNVCGAFSKLGGKSAIITMLGNDSFGDKIIEFTKENNISTNCILRTDEAQTSLSFVSRGENGSRDFSFFRKPGSDMLLKPEQIKKDCFIDCGVLHFCSVSLGRFPMREAHIKAIEYAKNNNAIISFDPNLRFNLWTSKSDLKYNVLHFMMFANIIKISSEELEFITGKNIIEDALDDLFVGSIDLIVYTLGDSGASAYTKKNKAHVDGIKGSGIIDTTGAGDAFIGSFLYQLCKDSKSREDLKDLTEEELRKYLNFSNRYCFKSIKKIGAISSYPTPDEMEGEL